jgi:DNA-binding response OmpR family regulator
MTRLRALVVDDEPAILRFLKPALEANDYEVASAATVGEAQSGSQGSCPTSWCSTSVSPTATVRK